LGGFLLWRNWGEGEDFRYANWRSEAGPKWWWYSFFKVYLLQGALMWIISVPLLMAQFNHRANLGPLEIMAVVLWLIGFSFEAGGDCQLARFKANPDNRGMVLNTGFWRFTRHPNYFGDAMQWWAFFLFALGAGAWWTFYAPLIMTVLLLKVSGVVMLEKTLVQTKPEYAEYIRRTPAFLPWFPKSN
jgi:steroid 5-alpha reductase family enzyme